MRNRCVLLSAKDCQLSRLVRRNGATNSFSFLVLLINVIEGRDCRGLQATAKETAFFIIRVVLLRRHGRAGLDILVAFRLVLDMGLRGATCIGAAVHFESLVDFICAAVSRVRFLLMEQASILGSRAASSLRFALWLGSAGFCRGGQWLLYVEVMDCCRL